MSSGNEKPTVQADFYYTGHIHHGQSTVTAKFRNAAQSDDALCDEKDLHDYIGITEGDTQKMYIHAIKDLQAYKTEHGIELDYKPYEEWDIE